MKPVPTLPERGTLPCLYSAMSTPRVEIFETARAQVAVFTQRSPEREDDNQDAVLVLEHGIDTVIAAVADGAGGYPGGSAASALALEALARACEEGQALPARAAILNGFEAAHAAIKAAGGGAATTLAVIELSGATLRTYHAGDSGIVVCGQRGAIKLNTLPHSPTGYAVEAGLLDEADALHHEERHMVSNLVGLEPMSVQVGSPCNLAPRDTVLIATDGVFDNLYLSEIVSLIRKGPLLDACSRLSDAAINRMVTPPPGSPCKPDDLAIVIVRRS